MRRVLLAGFTSIGILAATLAQAAPPDEARSPLQPIAIAELPAHCQALAVTSPSARIVDPDFAAHISVANCLAEDAMAKLALQPDPASVAALQAAAGPSLAILDDVIDHGDPHWKLLADMAKADLYTGMVVRMRVANSDPLDHAKLEPRLVPWLDGASRATEQARELALTEPVGDDPASRHEVDRLLDADAVSTFAAAAALVTPGVVHYLRDVMAVDARIAADRQRLDRERAAVAADRRLLQVDEGRVAAFRTAWDRAVAHHHAAAAGRFAERHQAAVVDERNMRGTLSREESNLVMARGALVADQQHLSDLEEEVVIW
jgi:hypothetical protein